MEFLNPEGVELPPPPPPPMIPPNVVMLVAEEKPVELFANTSTPKLIPMARPDNGTKGQRILTNHFKGAVNKSYGERERIAYCGGDQPFQVCESADFPCITVAKLKKPAYFPLEDNECDCIRNLQRDEVKPLLRKSGRFRFQGGLVCWNHYAYRDYPGRYTPVYLNAWELRAREPDHIPVSVEKDASSDIPDIDMTKYNVHRDMPLKEFVDFIRLRIQHDFPWNKNIESPIGTTLMSEVDEKNRDKYGFVRITYSGKEKEGWTR